MIPLPSSASIAGLDPSLRRSFERALADTLGLVFDDADPVWSTNRVVLISGGWRAGKSTRAAFKVLCKILEPPCPLIWLVGPDYEHAKEEFRYVMEWCLKLRLIENPDTDISLPSNGPRWLRTKTGTLVETKSAQHPERLASVPPNGIVLCEPGQMSSEVYEMAQGRLAETRGWMWLAGTLESALNKPRWMWYEDLARGWLNNGPQAHERSFCVPTWSNRVIFPGGIDDPELVRIRATTSDYTWQRRYGGFPEGVDSPVFDIMWQNGAEEELFRRPEPECTFDGGAIGVDYGRTFEHPSAIVAISMDNYGRYWVKEGWQGIKADPSEIEDVVDAFKLNHGIYQGCVDPNQGYLGDSLGFAVATGGSGRGGKPTEFRISLVSGLLEQGLLLFDPAGPNVREIWASMRMLGREVNARGEKVYGRPLGDDYAQALMYAVELLRGGGALPLLDLGEQGGVRMHYLPSGSSREAGI